MNRINWNEPRFGDEERKIIEEVLRNNYVNEGPKTKELEEEIKKFLGVNYAIITTNATAALALAVEADAAIKKKKKFEYLVPDLTMLATASAVSWAGGTPILVDVIKRDGTINVEKLEDRITEDTIGIIPVHTVGRAANMESIMKIAKKCDLTVIEDAAGALTSKNIDGKYLGTIGSAGVYSLQSNKIITSGQGGIIVTNNQEYYEKMRRLRDFGRLSNKEFIHAEEGYNLKFNDLSAALALGQLKGIESKKNRLLMQREEYFRYLSDLEEISFFPLREGEVPLWVDIFAKERDNLASYLRENNIFPRECWPALHMNPPYAYQGEDKDFPVASKIAKEVLWLPNGPALEFHEINYISDKIREFYQK